MASFPELVRGTLHQEFERRQFDAGHVTRDVMESLMTSMTTKILAQIESVNTHRVPEIVEGIGDQNSERFQRWTWGGQMHPVPEGFEVDATLPSATLFQLYLLGDEQAGIGPYKKLKSDDVVSKKAKARVSDMHMLMGPVIESLKKQGEWYQQPTVHEVNTMWQRGKAVIRGDEKSTKARKRRHKELAWTTVLNEYRKRGRVSNDQSHEEDSVDNNSNDSVGSVEGVGGALRPPKDKDELDE